MTDSEESEPPPPNSLEIVMLAEAVNQVRKKDKTVSPARTYTASLTCFINRWILG
jgi:hypothetical protein